MPNELSLEVIEKHLIYVFGECSNNASHHGYCCPDCPHYKKCIQVVSQIKSILSQKEVSKEEKKVFKEKWIPILESSAILLESSEISGTYNIDIDHDDFGEMLKAYEALREEGK